MLDIIASLDRTSQLLIVGRGILKFPQFGAVKPNALGDPVNRLAPDFPAQVQIHIHPLAGVD